MLINDFMRKSVSWIELVSAEFVYKFVTLLGLILQ